MGKVVIPKNSASLDEVMGAMQIYYDAGQWLSNADFIQEYKSRIGIIGNDTDSSAYTKKTEIGCYYGFLEWEDINRKQSDRRITPRGCRFLEHYNAGDTEALFEDIMRSLEEVTFGRNNFACQSCDSDIEPPALFLRAMLDMKYLTNTEFALLVYSMEYEGCHYTDMISHILKIRENSDRIELPDEAKKFSDPKPIVIMERWGVLTPAEKGRTISSSFLAKYSNRLRNLKIYNIDKDVLENSPATQTQPIVQPPAVSLMPRAKGGLNKIFYGAPGCGKSRHVSDMLAEVPVDESNIIRVTFHPEYANCDFIGQILPTVEMKTDEATGEEKEIVKYIFNPGPFTLALQKAYETNEMVFLIVEEINRGNAAAIFGDMFQLLDRVKDSSSPNYSASEYPVSNPNMQKYLISTISDPAIRTELEKGVFIPSNLTIYATMNSSDQNVFTLDTAFKRRWFFEQISNDINKDSNHDYRSWYVPGTEVTWALFLTKLNDKILDYKLQNQTNEDKRLGKYFVTKDCLVDPTNIPSEVAEIAQNFSYKVLEYVWNDVCKIGREEWFDTEHYKTLEDLIEAFVNPKEGETPLSVFQNITF